MFVGCWAPQGVKETLVRLKDASVFAIRPHYCRSIVVAHSEVRLRQHVVATPPFPRGARRQTRPSSCTTSFGLYNLVNIPLAIVHEW